MTFPRSTCPCISALPLHHRLGTNILGRWQVNWEKAANDYGSASVQSFKKMIQNAFKKVKDGEAAGGDDGTGSSEIKEGKKKTATPGSRKKKAKAVGPEQNAEESPTKKQKVAAGGRKKKGEKAAAESSTAAGEQEEGNGECFCALQCSIWLILSVQMAILKHLSVVSRKKCATSFLRCSSAWKSNEVARCNQTY